MSRTEQTQTAVLGALGVMPMTGYALREEIRSVLGHFWSESFGQIYPALAELQRQGLVERRGADRARASVFAITPAGTARLRELLSEPAQPVRPRNGLMLRLFFGRQLGPEACRNLIREAREEAEARLAELAVARSESQEGPHAQDRPYWLLTISAGEHAARAAIAWADDALEALDALFDPAAPNPAAEPPGVSETADPPREHP